MDLADIEVVQALRRYVRKGEIDADAAEMALDDFWLRLPAGQYQK